MGENQKKTTDSYRKNWDRIFSKKTEQVLIEEEIKENSDDG